MRSVIFLFLFLFLSLGPVCRAQAEPSPHQESAELMAKQLGIELPRRPWHMVNLWWSYEGATANATNLAIDITIDRDVPDSYNLYIAPDDRDWQLALRRRDLLVLGPPQRVR